MVQTVLTITRETETTMDEERVKQMAAVKACVELLGDSTDHYENLVLLKDEIRKREKSKQHPPFIEPSTSNVWILIILFYAFYIFHAFFVIDMGNKVYLKRAFYHYVLKFACLHFYFTDIF